VTNMETIRILVTDYYRLVMGRTLLGFGPERSSEEVDARATVKRFARGNVAMQADLFVSEQDLEYERDEVAKSLIRN
jgi:hypothetical protein